MHQNGSDGYFSFTFLLVAGIKVENSKLRTCQNMAWKGFCSLVIYTNLHNLPCICIKIYQNGSDGYFFHFLVIVGIKGEKRKLSTWQNMVWKASLLFGALCYSSQFAVYMHQNGSDGNRFTFLVSLGIKIEKKKLETWQNMAWTAFLLFGDLC